MVGVVCGIVDVTGAKEDIRVSLENKCNSSD